MKVYDENHVNLTNLHFAGAFDDSVEATMNATAMYAVQIEGLKYLVDVTIEKNVMAAEKRLGTYKKITPAAYIEASIYALMLENSGDGGIPGLPSPAPKFPEILKKIKKKFQENHPDQTKLIDKAITKTMIIK